MLKIPAVVRRNTILLALSQALVGSGTQMVPALGPLVVTQLLGSASLAGIGTSINAASRTVIAYPLGKVMDAHGRRAGLALGLSLGLVGAAIIGAAVLIHSFSVFVGGMLILGLGVGAAQQLRLAAADMYPPSRRAEGLGYVATGSLLGALGGPVIVTAGQAWANAVNLDPLALPWFIVPVVILPTILFLWFLRPDPKDIGAHLERYYPGYVAEPATDHALASDKVSVRALFQYYPRMVAIVASCGIQGVMLMVMVMNALALHHHGHSLPAISVSVAIHVLGMYALSLPFGRLSDWLGRRSVVVLGVIISMLGAILLPITPHYWLITAGAFLVGVGWSCINVAATAIIADTTSALERGRAIGATDTLSSATGFVMPFLGGVVVDVLGLSAVGIFGAAVLAVPLLLALRLHETSPGRFVAVVGKA